MPLWVPPTLKSISPKEVFQALDVCKHNIVVVCIAGHQTAGNTGYHGALIGTPAAIRDRVEAQMLAWEVEPLDSMVSDTVRIAYGNSSSLGSTGIKRPLCQSAMADLAASRSSGRLCLANGEGREVIVVHISLAGLVLIQTVQASEPRTEEPGYMRLRSGSVRG